MVFDFIRSATCAREHLRLERLLQAVKLLDAGERLIKFLPVAEELAKVLVDEGEQLELERLFSHAQLVQLFLDVLRLESLIALLLGCDDELLRFFDALYQLLGDLDLIANLAVMVLDLSAAEMELPLLELLFQPLNDITDNFEGRIVFVIEPRLRLRLAVAESKALF